MLTELKKLTCICCGGELTEKDGKLVCKYCKSTFEEAEKISEEEVVSLNRATTDRNLLRFDEALEEYNLLLKKYPQNEMANWGAFLCDYGIIYEQDYNGEYIPTCHRLNERPVSASPNYAKLSLEHQANANEIEKLRLSIMEKAKKIQPYDVFICYKATEEKRGVSVPTREASWARDIYELLTKKGLRVFFAEKSLAGSNVDYEPHIYSALRSAKLMFVLAGSIEHVNATWVANEWKRYAKYVRDGEEKTLRVVYDFINPYDLPKALQSKQAIDHNDMGWVEAINKAVEESFSNFVFAAQAPIVEGKYCSKCYALNAKDAKFCGECGNKDFIVAPDGVKYCVDCGAANQLKLKFCAECGKNKFVYTKEDYQKEVERRERERIITEEKERKTKAFLKIFIPIIAAIVAMIIAISAIDCGARNGLTMELSADKSYYIVTDCPENKTEAVIPDTYNGKPVKEIGEDAFDYCDSLTSITIPDSVTSIGFDAFSYCESLTSVRIGDSVTYISSSAFYGCSSLTSIYITDIAAWCNISGLSNLMGHGASIKNLYLNNELVTELIIPDGITSIGYQAFYGCSSLTSIEIPDSVTSIGYQAFYGCSSLTSITFKDTSTWYQTRDYNNWQNKTGGTQTSVTSPSNNATYFTDTYYYDHYWYKL